MKHSNMPMVLNTSTIKNVQHPANKFVLTFSSKLQLDENLMPDALHPNAEGMDLFAACFAEDVHHYMGRATSF